jgi:hypothetical protein
VSCAGSLDGRAETTILDVDAYNSDVVKRFGVELVNRQTTEATTVFAVTCTFTYVDVDASTSEQKCERRFNIVDCKGPEYDDDHQHCEFTGCAGKPKPGLFEACGGKIIRASPNETFVDEGPKDCCQGCRRGQLVECVSLLSLPNAAEDLKRCEIVYGQADAYGNDDEDNDDEGNDDEGDGGNEQEDESVAYGKDSAVVPLSVFLAAASVARDEPGMTALVFAGALVAVVAFIAVKRRILASHRLLMTDDVYFPLLS